MLMFYTGQWGGGDSKMLMALGSLLGFTLDFKKDFLLNLLINIVIAGGLYAVAGLGILVVFSKKYQFWNTNA